MSNLDESSAADFDNIRKTLRANGVMRYGRFERDNTYEALNALARSEKRMSLLLGLINRDIEGQYEEALEEAGLSEPQPEGGE